MQAKQDTTELQEKSKSMKKDIEAAVQRVDAAVAARDTALLTIGNLVHESVPVDNDEASTM
jgi:seryl-tRNA synthetase